MKYAELLAALRERGELTLSERYGLAFLVPSLRTQNGKPFPSDHWWHEPWLSSFKTHDDVEHSERFYIHGHNSMTANRWGALEPDRSLDAVAVLEAEVRRVWPEGRFEVYRSTDQISVSWRPALGSYGQIGAAHVPADHPHAEARARCKAALAALAAHEEHER